MKKILNFLLTSFYVFVLMMLAIFTFWELYAEDYVKDHIKTEYGNDIKQTYNNSELIKELLGYESEG